MIKMVKKIIEYFKGLNYFNKNLGKSVNIKKEYRPQERACYGDVIDFNFKTGEIQIYVFDFGIWYKRYFYYYMFK